MTGVDASAAGTPKIGVRSRRGPRESWLRTIVRPAVSAIFRYESRIVTKMSLASCRPRSLSKRAKRSGWYFFESSMNDCRTASSDVSEGTART